MNLFSILKGHLKKRGKIFSIITFFGLIFLFQNCGQSVKFNDSVQVETASSASSPFGNQEEAAEENSDNSSSEIPSNGGNSNSRTPAAVKTPTATKTPTSTPTAAISTNCSSYVKMLGWAPTEDFQVNFIPKSNNASGVAEKPAYSGFSVAFVSSKVGPEIGAAKFIVANTGFSLKIDDVKVPNSSYISMTSLTTDQGGITSWSSDQKRGSYASFVINRDFYFSYLQSTQNVRVSLYCNNLLVASGIQDTRTLNYDLNEIYIKTSSGGYAPKDSKSGFVNVTCPSEALAGAEIKCTSAGVYIVSSYWLIDGQQDKAFDNVSTYSAIASTPGIHTVQRVVKYENGKEDRSLISIVKVR